MTDLITKLAALAALDPARATTDPVVDGGAHHGKLTAVLRAAFPQADILAIEPDPDNAVIARAAHQSDPKVKLIEAALAANEGQAVLHRGSFSATNSLLPRPGGGGQPYYPATATLPDQLSVPTQTIDGICAAYGASRLSLLKLDLQGGELSALKGAAGILTRGAVPVLLSEVVFIRKYERQPLFWDLAGFLEEFGYSFYACEGLRKGLYHQEPPGPRHGQWNQADAIFLSPAVRSVMDAKQIQP